MGTERAELAEILRQKSLELGSFSLSSGKRSSYYLDCRTTTLDPRGALLVARLILGTLRSHRIRADAVGGPTLGADPMVSAVTVVSGLQGRPIPGFIVRKEAKAHGTRNWIEGYRGKRGSRVVIVDDACTSGGSILAAIKIAEESGCAVVAVVCLVDREEGGSERIRARYPFYALFTGRELLGNGDKSR